MKTIKKIHCWLLGHKTYFVYNNIFPEILCSRCEKKLSKPKFLLNWIIKK